MDFVFGKNNENIKICLADDEWPGVKRIAGIVAGDILQVTDVKPEVMTIAPDDVTLYKEKTFDSLKHNTLPFSSKKQFSSGTPV